MPVQNNQGVITMKINIEKLKNNIMNSLDELCKDKIMLKGTLYTMKSKKCGMKNCQLCNSGKYHKVTQFTYRNQNGVKTSTTIKKEEYTEIRKAWENQRQFISNLRKLKKNLQILLEKIVKIGDSQLINVTEYKKNLKKGAKS